MYDPVNTPFGPPKNPNNYEFGFLLLMYSYKPTITLWPPAAYPPESTHPILIGGLIYPSLAGASEKFTAKGYYLVNVGKSFFISSITGTVSVLVFNSGANNILGTFG